MVISLQGSKIILIFLKPDSVFWLTVTSLSESKLILTAVNHSKPNNVCFASGWVQVLVSFEGVVVSYDNNSWSD